MANNETLQDRYLEELRRGKIQATVFLMNGFQLRGVVLGYDSFVVTLVSDGKQSMIYKHAISTITPFVPVKTAAL